MERFSPQPSKLLEDISEEEWTIHWNELRVYARKRFGWLEGRQGLNLEELVSKAIVDTMTGKRRWPPIDRKTGRVKTGVQLLPFLCEVLRSNVSHEWERIKRTVPIESSDYSGDARLRSLERLLTEESSSYPYLIQPESPESQAISNDLKARVYELISDDEDLVNILKLRYEGLKPKAVANELGLSMEAMRAAQKRLRRIVQKLLQEWNHGQE